MNARNARAVIYTRISDDQTGKAAGVERQTEECRALATRRGVTVIEELVDNDLSATRRVRRPGYERVLELLRDGMVDTVVVWHTDRLYRLPRDLEPIIDLAESRPVQFLTVTSSEIDLNTASGRMVARMLAAVSAQEVEHKAERQRSASDQRAAKGMPTSRPGYGYRRVDGRDVIDQDEAALIREVIGRVLAGQSLRSIASDLNAREVPSPRTRETHGARTNPWHPATLRQMVLRPSLAGLRTHRGQIVGAFDPELHPAIIDQATHERLVALLRDPRRRVSFAGRTPKYLLGGIARCGLCNGVMRRTIGALDPKTGIRKPPAYTCADCTRVRRKQSDVDAVVEAVLIHRLSRPDALDLFATGDDAAASAAREKLAAIDARLSNAADAYATGALELDQLTRITAALRAEREEATAALTRALPPAIPADVIGEHAAERWAALDMDTKRTILSTLMRVTIMPSGSGRPFKPEQVRIEWLHGNTEELGGDRRHEGALAAG